MKIRLANPNLQLDSIVDGEGVRAVMWTQGCPHHCFGCHNPETHALEGGYLVDIDDIKFQLKNLEGQDGLTLSGGDPFMQVEACLEIVRYARTLGLNIWCYTGYTYEALLQKAVHDNSILELLKNIDVLIDGPFILKEKSYDTIFRGSKNQRIIDVPKSLERHEVCLKEKYYRKSVVKPQSKLYV